MQGLHRWKIGGCEESDSVRVVDVSSGKHTVVITRPGKAAYTHSVVVSDPLFIDPDETDPRTIADNKPVRGTNSTTPIAQTIPAWMQPGLWVGPNPFRKLLTIQAGSTPCLVDLDRNVTFVVDGGEQVPTIRYSRRISLDIKSSSSGDLVCRELQNSKLGPGNDDWHLTIKGPVTLNEIGEDSAMFTIDITKCTADCDFSSTLTRVLGTVTKSGSGMKIVWSGQLAGEEEVYLTNAVH